MDLVRFLLIGLGAGGLYVLTAHGIVLAYRTSGTINFAHGAVAMASAFVFYEARDAHNWPTIPSLLVGLTAGAVLGLTISIGILRPLRERAALVRVMATIGVLVLLAFLFSTKYGNQIRNVRSPLPRDSVELLPDVAVGADRLVIFGIAVVLTAVLTLVYRRTKFGVQTAAVSENQHAAAALGISATFVDAVNWTVAGALGAAAGILIAPISGLEVSVLTFLVLPALAAALVGRFSSFPMTLLGGLGIGVAEAEVVRYFPNVGGGQTVSFVVIIAILVLRGASLPGKNEVSSRLGKLGSGKIDLRTLVPGVALAIFLVLWLPISWLDPFTVSMASAIVLLSYVVVTGYCGQVSLAQYAIAGMGAWFAGRAVVNYGIGLELAIPVGVLCTVPIGVLVAMPAMRIRGATLAVATLGLAAVLQSLVLHNSARTGGIDGTPVGQASLFGVNVDAFQHPERYALLTLASLLFVSLIVSNIRRGVSGRRLIAVRGNERAAASVGISVVGAKLFAFGMAAAIAALGGILLAFRSSIIIFEQFSLTRSLTSVADAVIGGLGHVIGPLFGALLAPGGLGSRPFHGVESVDRWLTILGGGLLVVMLLIHPTGLADSPIAELPRKIGRLIAKPFRRTTSNTGVSEAIPAVEASRPANRVPRAVTPARLEVRGLTVKFGGVVAVDNVSLDVQPGEVVGLIGPNGAGKTTLVDAVTGFLPTQPGTVLMNGRGLDKLSVHGRSRVGLARSFQSVELFEDLTIYDNIRSAIDPHGFAPYVTDLVRPHNTPLTEAAEAAIEQFNLKKLLYQRPSELSFGYRRLAAIARSVAAEPSILLLDEPAAGLDRAESDELGALIKSLARDWNMSVLLIEHDVDLVLDISDRVNVLVFGAIIAHGTPDEIRTNQRVLEAYLGSEAVLEVHEEMSCEQALS